MNAEINEEKYLPKDVKLLNPEWFIILSFFFTFLPASFFFALNYLRMGEKKKFILVVCGSIALFTASFNCYFPLLSLSIGYGIYMRNAQSLRFKNHVENGGAKGSVIIPLVVSFWLGMFIYFLWFSRTVT